MPPAVATGYFGALTGAAVSAYRRSVGLPANSSFDSSTRNSLILDLASNSVLPYTGLEAVATSTFSQIAIQSVESLYTTPLNAGITLILLAAIAFVAFKLIRALLIHRS